MRYGQLMRRVQKILRDTTPYRWSDEAVRAIVEQQRGRFGVPEKFRREIVQQAARIFTEGARHAE